MQCGEGADEANYDGGGCGYVGSVGNDGGGGKEKNHHIHTTNTNAKTITFPTRTTALTATITIFVRACTVMEVVFRLFEVVVTKWW